MLNWKGVTIQEHNFFVNIAFYVEGVEIGHPHGDSIVDLNFPAKVSERLARDRYVSPHHAIPDPAG